MNRPDRCDHYQHSFVAKCTQGQLDTFGKISDHLNCIEKEELKVTCYDPISKQNIRDQQTLEVESFPAPVYEKEGDCDKDRVLYTATCSQGRIARTGEILNYRTCIERPVSLEGEAYFLYKPFGPYGPPIIKCGQEFTLGIQNNSNKVIQFDQNNIKFFGPVTKTNYRSSLVIVDNGCSSGTLAPRSGCSITSKSTYNQNNSASPMITMPVSYDYNKSQSIVDKALFENEIHSPYVTLQGCQISSKTK